MMLTLPPYSFIQIKQKRLHSLPRCCQVMTRMRLPADPTPEKHCATIAVPSLPAACLLAAACTTTLGRQTVGMAARDGAALKPVLSGLSMKPVPSGERLREAHTTAERALAAAEAEGDDPAAIDGNLVLAFLATRDGDFDDARQPRICLRAQRRGAHPRGALRRWRRRSVADAIRGRPLPPPRPVACSPAAGRLAQRREEKSERERRIERRGKRGRLSRPR
uniref:Uncharacterized protein n=1 Tax=Oryza rufipogon TaxID=4529 RepID=A0A0E0R977_ORYRU